MLRPSLTINTSNPSPTNSKRITGASTPVSSRRISDAAGHSGGSSPAHSPHSSPHSSLSNTATPKRLDPYSQRKQQLSMFLKYLSNLLHKAKAEDMDEYVRELQDAVHHLGMAAPTATTADERAFAEYYHDIEGHDPDKLSAHMEDIASLILSNPSASERENKRDRLLHGYTNLKTSLDRKSIAQALDADGSSDISKYQSICKLFDINYFASNSFYEIASTATGDRLSATAKKVNDMKAKERKEIHDQRQKELNRARTAKLFFNKASENPSAGSSPISSHAARGAHSCHI